MEILFLFGIYLFVINGYSLILMVQDKVSARLQKGGADRVPEGKLFFLAILGGSLGVYAGMFLSRHKTNKLYFSIGLPILIIQQILLFIAFGLPFLEK